jgi:hypothetical protein
LEQSDLAPLALSMLAQGVVAAYCVIQTIADVRRRKYGMAAWGLLGVDDDVASALLTREAVAQLLGDMALGAQAPEFRRRRAA